MSGGFIDGNGATVRPPAEVQYRFGCRHGRLIEAFHDGGALVRFYDNWHATEDVNWCHLCAVPNEYLIGPPDAETSASSRSDEHA